MGATLAPGERQLGPDGQVAHPAETPITASVETGRSAAERGWRGDARPMVDWDAEIGGLLSSLSPYDSGYSKSALKPLFPAFDDAGFEGRATGRRGLAVRDGEESAAEGDQRTAVLPATRWEWRVEAAARNEGEEVL
jgi:hypothetical protein